MTLINNEENKNLAAIDFLNYSLEEELDKVEGLGVSGYKVLLRIHQAPVTKTSILMPENISSRMKEDERFSSISGLVLKFGPGAYDLDRFKKIPPYCSIGQWVAFLRGSGSSVTYNGVDYIFIDDDLILGPVDDPRKISKIKAT